MSNVISATDVWFAYDGEDAVAGVTFSAAQGEFVSLLGPNGSGKTTLVRLLCGAVKPRKGTIELFGRSIDRMSRGDVARTVAVVPQETRSVFPFTVEEIVLMGRFPHLGPYGFEGERDFEAAREAMRVTDTLQFASRHIEELSGGERQRVIIARALAQEARVLLLDEPTAFLDIRHQLDVARLVKELQSKRGLTVVAASHDLNLAAAVSDRLVLLSGGRVYAEGTPGEVLREDVLRQAYGAAVQIGQIKGRPFVVPDFSEIDSGNGG